MFACLRRVSLKIDVLLFNATHKDTCRTKTETLRSSSHSLIGKGGKYEAKLREPKAVHCLQYIYIMLYSLTKLNKGVKLKINSTSFSWVLVESIIRLLRKTVLRDWRDFLEASREFTICSF